MADGNVSDASPPRRRNRRDDINTSDRRYRPSRLSQPRDSLVRRQSPNVRSSPTRRLPETASGFRTCTPSEDDIKPEGTDTVPKEDVSDASPPRQRRRIDYPNPHNSSHSKRISPLNKNSLTSKPMRAENMSRRGNRLAPSIPPDETLSIQSIAGSNREQRTDRNYSNSTSPSAHIRSANNVRAPRNRFGIKPGPRWDGVNRSNGFEQKLDAMQSMRKDVELEGYRASVADL